MTETCRHPEWVKGELYWNCTDCGAESVTCGTCGRPSGTHLLLCERCQRQADRVLDDIEAALSHYERDPRSLVSSPGDMRLVPVPSGSSVDALETPGQIRDRLWAIVARWTEYVGAQNSDAIDALKAMHIWAAQNPEKSGWTEYLHEARLLRHQARRIAGLLPKRLAEPCVHCGGQCVQDWSDDEWQPLETGLSDVIRCTGCNMTWDDHAGWRFATRHHIFALPEIHPDSLVTLAQARMIFPDVPAATFRSWAQRWREDGESLIERALTWWAAECAWRRGERPWWAADDWKGPGEAPSLAGWLPERGERDGETLYRVGDVLELVNRRADENRRGRRAVSERIGS